MKKKMLKIFAATLSLLFIVLCGACGGKNGGNEPLNYEEIFSAAAAKFTDVKNPVAAIVMANGKTITAELYPETAENTVNNFISLANKGYYDGIIFHRVIDDFMIQTGDPTGTGNGGPGYTIKGEFANNGYNNTLSHDPGVLSMARQGNRYNPSLAYNTAGSQFFICVDNCSHLNGDYAAFGKVIDGMDTVNEIIKVQTDANDKPVETQKMMYVRVDTHGVSFPEPETIPE